MKRTIPTLIFLLATSSATAAQFAPGTKNLRGLTGVRLIVMFHRADGLEEEKRPEVLKLLEADVTAKLQEAGIPLLRYAGDVQRAGGPRLIVLVTLDKLNGFVHPVVIEVKLLQTVRLVRDPTIEYEATTWSLGGVGGPKLRIEMIRHLVAGNIDRFIKDYWSENPKQTAQSRKD